MRTLVIALGCLFGSPLLWYAAHCAAGWPVRTHERKFIEGWLRGDPWGGPSLGHLSAWPGSGSILYTHASLDLATRYTNNGAPFITLNLDHYGWGAWWIGHRLRPVVDRLAARENIPAILVPYRAWARALTHNMGSTFHLIERKHSECVFSMTPPHAEPAYYLSGFDRNETPALYFLTQLPRPVTSIRDARESLKPPSVLLAEQGRRRVYRQGDMFAVPTKMTSAEIEAAGGTIESQCWLYGTAHLAERVATLPNGTQFAWGRLQHRPTNRVPDHHLLRLKRGRWHLVAKNMTPMRVRGGVK